MAFSFSDLSTPIGVRVSGRSCSPFRSRRRLWPWGKCRNPCWCAWCKDWQKTRDAQCIAFCCPSENRVQAGSISPRRPVQPVQIAESCSARWWEIFPNIYFSFSQKITLHFAYRLLMSFDTLPRWNVKAFRISLALKVWLKSVIKK